MISTSDVSKAKHLIKNSKEKPIIIEAQDIKFNRKMLEYGKFDILLNIEKTKPNKKDKPKQLDSGLNHVLAKLSAKNKVFLGIDLEEIRSLEKKEKAKRLSYIKQNIKIARKAKTNLILINYKDKLNAQSLLLSLHASTSQSKQSTH